MAEPTSDKHYEEKFQFPLWTLIKQRAEERDISYYRALKDVLPEYVKTIRYRDEEFEKAERGKRITEMQELGEREAKEGLFDLSAEEKRLT